MQRDPWHGPLAGRARRGGERWAFCRHGEMNPYQSRINCVGSIKLRMARHCACISDIRAPGLLVLGGYPLRALPKKSPAPRNLVATRQRGADSGRLQQVP